MPAKLTDGSFSELTVYDYSKAATISEECNERLMYPEQKPQKDLKDFFKRSLIKMYYNTV